MTTKTNDRLEITYIPVKALKAAVYNPRKWSDDQLKVLMESIDRFGTVDPLIVNRATTRKNILIGGHMRLAALKKLGRADAPVVYVDIPDEKKERELNLRLNRNTGEWNLELLGEFDESLLSGIGFTSEELDDIFPAEEHPEEFDLKMELEKLDIKKVTVKKGDRYDFGAEIGMVMCGDSTAEHDMLKLMADTKADMVCTDPPYILDYLHGKK